MMFVRTAGQRDVAAIRALLAEIWHATYDAIYGAPRVNEIIEAWHAPQAVARNIDQPEGEFLVADDGTQIAGMAFAIAADSGKTISLRQLYVRPSMQGRGVGGLLLDEIEGSFHDAEKVRLEVEEANAKAIAFYVAQGFVEVGKNDGVGGAVGPLPALVFERPIVWAD